ncbi:MAG TPA: plastocyanin/azurin family copper-binding protein [Nitrososphaeraceae archaeon]|jgi:plastocyanin
MLSIKMYNYSINTAIIITTILIIGVNLSFSSANAQISDFRLEQIQHMMGHRPHMMGPGPHHGMMGNRMQQQMQQSKLPSHSIIGGNNTMSNKKSINVSIVFGATMRTTTAYQPNPVYIKEGQAITWTNNDNNIHTVTQRDYSNSGSNHENTTPLPPFSSGLLNSGQSFAQLFYKGGKYDYYCTIHPWMIGQVIVSTNSNTTGTSTNNNNNNNNNNNKSSLPPSSSMSMSMMQRGNIAMGFDQNNIRHHFIPTANGGNIVITSLNTNDTKTINQIKEHIKDIQNDFSKGNFTKPFFIHAQDVPGTKIMAEKKDLINYSINELSNGSVLILKTMDKEALNAMHQFLTFQNAQHESH